MLTRVTLKSLWTGHYVLTVSRLERFRVSTRKAIFMSISRCRSPGDIWWDLDNNPVSFQWMLDQINVICLLCEMRFFSFPSVEIQDKKGVDWLHLSIKLYWFILPSFCPLVTILGIRGRGLIWFVFCSHSTQYFVDENFKSCCTVENFASTYYWMLRLPHIRVSVSKKEDCLNL